MSFLGRFIACTSALQYIGPFKQCFFYLHLVNALANHNNLYSITYTCSVIIMNNCLFLYCTYPLHTMLCTVRGCILSVY